MPMCSSTHSVRLGQLRSDTPCDECADRKREGAHAKDESLVGGHGCVVDGQEGCARHEVHRHAEPVADCGTVTFGDELTPEKSSEGRERVLKKASFKWKCLFTLKALFKTPVGVVVSQPDPPEAANGGKVKSDGGFQKEKCGKGGHAGRVCGGWACSEGADGRAD